MLRKCKIVGNASLKKSAKLKSGTWYTHPMYVLKAAGEIKS